MFLRDIHMRYGKLLFALMLVASVGACGESTSPSSSKQEPASTAEIKFAELKKQADSGDAVAQYNLGSSYHTGKDVPKDYAKAFQWFEKAAAQGNTEAQGSLGLIYARGEGVPKDAAKAAEWL